MQQGGLILEIQFASPFLQFPKTLRILCKDAPKQETSPPQPFSKLTSCSTLSNQIATFEGHQGGVNSVSFSPNGEYIVTGSDDRTARLWRVRGLDELLAQGCDWLKYYLASRPEELAKLKVCHAPI
jgi:WD40 repeat protein